ncbi:pullulanase-associated domain-containing protein [Chitinimonas sp.]|uniref:pullulanase-associated domain-containing protein n=1 Tax=Chitinimonas sp. TaxID=1934313 RepID=UPI0035AE381F
MKRRKLLLGLVAGLLLTSLPAFAADLVLAADEVAIHYHRPDGNYKNWGVHAWKRAPGSSDQPLDGISWGSPATPDGSDDFGVYWKFKIKDFGSTGIVHYIIHKGDSKEQKGGDQQFDSKEAREIWVMSGDATLYKSKAEALAAAPR